MISSRNFLSVGGKVFSIVTYLGGVTFETFDKNTLNTFCNLHANCGNTSLPVGGRTSFL